MPYNFVPDSFHTAVTAEALRAIIDLTAEELRAILVVNRRFRFNEGRLTQNFRWKGSPPTNHSSSQKTRLNVLSYGIKIWRYLSSILSQITRLTDRQTDRRTDGQTDRILITIPRLHYMQRGKN